MQWLIHCTAHHEGEAGLEKLVGKFLSCKFVVSWLGKEEHHRRQCSMGTEEDRRGTGKGEVGANITPQRSKAHPASEEMHNGGDRFSDER